MPDSLLILTRANTATTNEAGETPTLFEPYPALRKVFGIVLVINIVSSISLSFASYSCSSMDGRRILIVAL